MVDTCTVSSVARSARWVTSVSGVALAKLPPMPTKTSTPAAAHGANSVDRVQAVLPGRGDAELGVQRAEHAGMVGAGVVPDHEDQFGVVGDVLQTDGALADADRPVHCEAGDSWHMFEQSGRLLVPSRRARSR